MERKYSGYFITLEGGEGCGKTYQLPYLIEALIQKGFKVVQTREPGGNIISEEIRKILHDNKNTDMHPRTETLLYQASRAQVVERVIMPKLKEGFIVLCDRFGDSTKAYQGYGHMQDIGIVSALVDYATGGLTPDLTILIDLDPEIGVDRKKLNNCELNRMDLLPADFYERVRRGYLKMASEEPDRWIVVDGNQTKHKVFSDLLNAIEGRLLGDGFIESEQRRLER